MPEDAGREETEQYAIYTGSKGRGGQLSMPREKSARM